MNMIFYGFLASFVAGASTGFGALSVLFVKDVSDRLLDLMLSFAAGVMLASSSFSLLVPALELGGMEASSAGLAAGALTIHIIDRYNPHEHIWKGREGRQPTKMSGLMLMIIAITIHNFPEELAVR